MKLISFNSQLFHNLKDAIQKEWVETNVLGTYASSTITLTNTRKFHGIFVPALTPPLGHHNLIASLDDQLMIVGTTYPLATHLYPGTAYPEGFYNLDEFFTFPFPTWIYRIEDLMLAKTLILRREEQTVIVRYQIVSGDEEWVRLEIRPMMPSKLINPSHPFTGTPGCLKFELTGLEKPLYIYHNAAIVEKTNTIYKKVQYPSDRDRADEFEADLLAPCRLGYTFAHGGILYLCASVHDYRVFNPSKMILEEERKRLQLFHDTKSSNVNFQILARSAHSLIVDCGRTGCRSSEEADGVAAPWQMLLTSFPDPKMDVRDALIGFHGIFLTAGQFESARKVLSWLIQQLHDGLLPKHFQKKDGVLDYASVDIPLWFIHACYEYYKYSKDENLLRELLYPAMQSIIESFVRGSLFNIHVTKEGLLECPDETMALTWMDAQIGDYVVTPRAGMAVEVQALWYNALCEMAELGGLLNINKHQENYSCLAKRTKISFNQLFWLEASSSNRGIAGYLCDFVQGKKRDIHFRPNQLLALGLPFSILDFNEAKWASLLTAVEQHLLTPFGLKTLASFEDQYVDTCGHSETKRCYALHQGSVWPWLLVSYVMALFRLKGSSQSLKTELYQYLGPLWAHLSDRGLGFVSEVFDGNGDHLPKGTFAKASNMGACLQLQEILTGSTLGLVEGKQSTPYLA